MIQLMIGPNSYGIAEMLGANVEYPENQLPYIRKLYLDELEKVDVLGQIEIKEHPRMKVFTDAASILEKEALKTVPVSQVQVVLLRLHLIFTEQKNFCEILERIQRKYINCFE